MNPGASEAVKFTVVGDDVDARYAYPSVRRFASGIRVVPRKNPSLCNERGFFYALNII